jgi:hypothetical protein
MSEKQLGLLRKAMEKGEQMLDRLKVAEKKSRDAWTNGYYRFRKAANDLVGLKMHGTQREERLKQVITQWDEETVRLTAERDVKREALRKQEEALRRQKTEIAVLEERLRNENSHRDEIVAQVFALTETVVRALADRNVYLNEHLYPLLVDEEGKLRTQITFTSTDGLRRVVAMVNHLAIVDTALAAEAQSELEKFFRRFTTETEKDDTTTALIEILEKVLIERVQFKVGPDLYRFLSLDLESTAFPELKKAQMLLRSSMRSEKTGKYIRLYQREAEDKSWVEVKLT